MELQPSSSITFLFSGQGAQYVNMGKSLYETEPVFRENIDLCARILQPHLPVALMDVLYPQQADQSPISETRYAQPALFALGYALARLWEYYGITPSFVIGHSLGELIAACFAGIMRIEDMLPLVVLRGKLMQEHTSPGSMVVLLTSHEQAEQIVAPYPDEVSIAAINGESQIVISGSQTRIAALQQDCEENFIPTQVLNISVAVHSPLMNPILELFKVHAQTISYSPARVPLVSVVRGEQIGSDEILDTTYWCRQIREPVLFMKAVRSVAPQSRVFLEIGSGSTLITMGKRCLPKQYDGLWLASMRQGEQDKETFSATLEAISAVSTR